MNKQSRDCFDDLLNLSAADERMQTAMTAFSRYASYWELHNRVREQDRGAADFCAALPTQVAERAVEGERDLRILLKEGLDAVNELSDSGRMESVIRKAADYFAKQDIGDLEEGIRVAQKAWAEHYPDADLSFFDQGIDLLKSNIEGLRAEKEGIKVTYKTGDRKKQDVVIEPKPRPGQLGRINAREFFGHTSNAYTITGQVPIFVPEDCHHRNQITISDELVDVLDVYGSLANSFIGAKERAYRHTRKVNEIGISYRQGNDPITAVIVILAAVAAALVIAGAVIEIGCAAGAWSGDVCNWGWGLIFAGIVLGGIVCVAAGACDFVIALLLHIIV